MYGELLEVFNSFLKKLKETGILKEYVFEYKLMDSSGKKIDQLYELIRQLNDLKKKYLSENGEQQKPTTVNETVNICQNDPSLVQIKANKSELNNRIEAFIKRKRKEVDEWNVQEFCSHSIIDEDDPDFVDCDSCARVDAVFVPRSGSKSHVRISRVVNQWGPQTFLASHKNATDKKIKKEKMIYISPAVDERLRNMESHLKLKSGTSVSHDIYARIKALEDRILYLEGISPGYLHDMISDLNQSMKSRIEESKYAHWSISDIDTRIQALQEMLTQKENNPNGNLT